MSNGYKNHHHPHHQHHHNRHNQNITHLPLLCRASTQDIKVVVPRASGDPISPRVTCIGHVKRSNKVTGFPTPKFTTTTTTAIAATPSSRRSIHNSTYNSNHHHHQQQQHRFNKSKSAPRTPLKTITAATIATSPGVCGLPRGSILISNHSPLRPKTKHQKSYNPPNPSPRATATATTPHIHAPPRAIILNANYSTLNSRPVSKTTFEKSPASSWMNLNTTVKSNINYLKLKRLLFPEKTDESITVNSSRSREIKKENSTRSYRNYDVELDPPLPVVKKVKEPGFDREEVNIWKRRSSKTGIELKSLKIQQIYGNNNHHQIPTTV